MCLFALNMTWTHCEVLRDLDLEPSGNQWRPADGIWGVRYWAWRLFFFLDFDPWSMGAKPWNTSGGLPNPQTTQSHKPVVQANYGRRRWVVYPGICASGRGNTSSRTPLIIFVFGEFGGLCVWMGYFLQVCLLKPSCQSKGLDRTIRSIARMS